MYRGLELEQLSNETISQLSEFSCIPLVTEDVPFEQTDPSLKLYLARNPLPRAPGAIFNLEFLTVLSLRNTQVTELPPSIANLRNLTDLNVSLNRLQYLPGELLDLLQYPGKLRNLSIHPNPFCLPENIPFPTSRSTLVLDKYHPGGRKIHEVEWSDGLSFIAWLEDGLNNDLEYPQIRRLQSSRWQICSVGRSPVQYSDSRGVILSKFQLPTGETDISASEQPSSHVHVKVQTEDLTSTPASLRDGRGQAGLGASSGRVPSLFELSLKACSRSGQLPELPSYLPAHSPAQFSEVLGRLAAQAEDNANSGDVPCSVCGRRVMVPTASWIEWWDVTRTAALPEHGLIEDDPVSTNPQERFIPFARRGCGWGCVPRPTEVGRLRPGSVRWSLRRTADGTYITDGADYMRSTAS